MRPLDAQKKITLKQKKSHINNIKSELFYHICDILKIQCHTFYNAVFTKQFFSIYNLAHLFLQKCKQKPNKLNSFAQQIGLLRSFCASHYRSVKSASPAAAWYFIH